MVVMETINKGWLLGEPACKMTSLFIMTSYLSSILFYLVGINCCFKFELAYFFNFFPPNLISKSLKYYLYALLKELFKHKTN